MGLYICIYLADLCSPSFSYCFSGEGQQDFLHQQGSAVVAGRRGSNRQVGDHLRTFGLSHCNPAAQAACGRPQTLKDRASAAHQWWGQAAELRSGCYCRVEALNCRLRCSPAVARLQNIASTSCRAGEGGGKTCRPHAPLTHGLHNCAQLCLQAQQAGTHMASSMPQSTLYFQC